MDPVAPAQSFGEELAQVTFAGEMFGRMKDRVMQLAELNLQIAFLGDLQRVLHRLGHFVEQRFHLLRRAQVKLLRHIAHPLGVTEQALRADADERIVGVRVAFLDVMHVVGCNEFQTELFGPLNQVAIDVDLLRNRVVLQFEVKIFRAERLLEPVHRGARFVQLPALNQVRNFAGETAGERDEPLFVLRQDFLVDARLVVIALQMRRRGKFDKIPVTDLIFRQQHEMMVNVPAAARRLLVEAAAGSDIDLTANNRFDAFVSGGLVKINRAAEHAVIGDRERRESQLVRFVDQPVEAAGAIEQRILGVQMEVDKIRVRHEANYLPTPRGRKKGLFTRLGSRSLNRADVVLRLEIGVRRAFGKCRRV